MKIAYLDKVLKPATYAVIEQADTIIQHYQAQGYDLTLRQIYYQFVARDLFPDDRSWRQTAGGKWVRDPNGTKNAEPNYDWLKGIINDGRLVGLIDWDAIVDRTRHLRENSHWTSPSAIMKTAADQYLEDRWEEQPYRVEVWIEKDALVGIIEEKCESMDIPHFSSRGYASQSSMWRAGYLRIQGNHDEYGQDTIILHLADHDPSGMDMTRDIEERLDLFTDNHPFEIRRIALNMDQVRTYNPPPNPAKVSDSRSPAYIAEYGQHSWELDALEPDVLVQIIEDEVDLHIDWDMWEHTDQRITKAKAGIKKIADNYQQALDNLQKGKKNGRI